jgi:hypothetical protein
VIFEEHSMQHLIVVRPFGPHRPGDAITDPDEAAGILASEHAGHVVRSTPLEDAECPEEAMRPAGAEASVRNPTPQES